MARERTQSGASRRKFLARLAAAGLIGPVAAMRAFEAMARQSGGAEGEAVSDVMAGLTSASNAPQNVFDYQMLAAQRIPHAHYGYIATGVLDDATLRANREAFSEWAIRVRRLVDVTHIDLSAEVMGERWAAPIAFCPIGSQRAFHPEGEIAVARAAAARNVKQILSTVATASIEEVIAARGAPVWHQLYTTSDPEIGVEIMQRADRAGADAIVVTVDLTAGGMARETSIRYGAEDERDCSACHDRAAGMADFIRRKPMFDHVDKSRVTDLDAPWMTWDYIKRLRDLTDKKLLVKGIMTAEDARLAVSAGVDGLIVSNHGGRAEESRHATIAALPEIARAVRGRIAVLIDGGFRRGTDVFTALALGADAVCIGRPYVWGLGAAGQEGVQSVYDIIVSELRAIMAQAGTTSIAAIDRDYVWRRG
ncbi:MAG: alpha-hydroxy acid oxidase [Parvularculaceae bacterium]